MLSSGKWVAWDLRQGGEVQGGEAHADGGLSFAWAPTGPIAYPMPLTLTLTLTLT